MPRSFISGHSRGGYRQRSGFASRCLCYIFALIFVCTYMLIYHFVLRKYTTAMYLPTDQQADSVWTQLQSTVDTALHLPYDTVLLPLNLPQNPPDLPQLAAPSPPSFPTPTLSPTPPHSSPKPRKPRTYIPDIHALPVYKEVRHTQRVYAWKENATMLFPTSFQSQNLVLGLAFGIDVNHLAIFAQSLRSTRSDAIVVLFIDIPFILKQKRYREVIVQTNLLCVYVDVKSSFQSNRLFRSAKGHKELRHFHPSSLRWILYDRLLNAAIQYRNGIYINQREIDELYGAEEYSTVRRWGSLFEKVLVLDVRDSMFQTDPFDLLPTLPPPPPTPSSSLIPNFLHRNSHSEGSYDAYNSSLYAYPLTHYATGNSAGGLLRGSLLESIGAISPTDTGTSTNTGGTHLDRFTLYGFSEDLSLPIASCGWNSAWIRDCFTDNILMLMQENYIVCSGVSMGYIDVVHIYVHYMSLLLRGKQLALNRHTLASHDTFDYYNYLNHIDNAYAINNFKSNGLYNRNMQDIDTHIALINENTQFPKCERNGVDQGMHNVLIYLNLIPVKLLHHYKFPVINVQAAVANFEFSIQNNTMYNIDNQFQFSIVHQYDRYTPFQNMLIERFVPWLNLSDPISEFNETMSCAVFNYVKDVDMLRGQCDLSSQRALSFATCCELCSKKNTRIAELPSPTESNRTTLLRLYEESTCTAFTFAGGTCFFKSCKYNQTLTAYLLAQDLDKNPQLMEPAGISAFIKLE